MLHQVVCHALLDREDRFTIRQTGLYMARRGTLITWKEVRRKRERSEVDPRYHTGGWARVLPLARSYSPASLNSSLSAGNRRWRSRNPAMKLVHSDSRDSCRYRSRTLVRWEHACR